MGKVYVNTSEVGTFHPQTACTSGTIYIDTGEIGTFHLEETGEVLVNGIVVGTYEALKPVVAMLPLIVVAILLIIIVGASIYYATKRRP